MINISINSTSFQTDFGRLLAKAKNPRYMLVASGRELANQLKIWFRQKDRTNPNKLSERRSHFWLAVSRTVSQPTPAGYNSIGVSINHPTFAQKVFGGTIPAKAAGMLTIPVEERAYGRTAGKGRTGSDGNIHNFEAETGLKLFLLRIGKGANHFEKAVLAVKEGKGFTVEYILKRSVVQQPDPTALPPVSVLEKAILERAQRALNSETKMDAFKRANP